MSLQQITSQRSICRQTTQKVSCITPGKRSQVVVASAHQQNNSSSTTTSSDKAHHQIITRRDLGVALTGTVGLVQLLSALPAAAEGEQQQYVDPQDSFKLVVPANWQSTEGLLEGNRSFTGASGARRTIAWYSPDVPADQVNVTLTITNTSVEFTKLGSFGNVFAFGTNLVNSMDRSFLLRMRNAMPADGEPVQVAKLLDAKDTRDMYQLEYSVEKVPGPKRHLYSLVALAFNGRYNRLYTLTAQCLEEQVPQYEQVLLQVLSSFQPPAAVSTA